MLSENTSAPLLFLASTLKLIGFYIMILSPGIDGTVLPSGLTKIAIHWISPLIISSIV